MGNVLLEGPNKKGDPAQQYQRWLQQNPDLVGKQILSENKLFRTSSYKYNGRNIIIKVYFRRDQSPLNQYTKILDLFNQFHQKIKTTNIMPLKIFNQKDNQAFIVAYRQKISQTLEDVILAKPTPSEYKKKWLIYQMIKAVDVIHRGFNFYHGHVRTSNFVMTSYGYLMLTDLSFYKPLYMHEDTEGLSEFRIFYGSSKILQHGDLKTKQRSPAKVFTNYQPFLTSPGSYATNYQLNNQSQTLLQPPTDINTSTATNSNPNPNQSIPPSHLSMTMASSRTESQMQKPRGYESIDMSKYQTVSYLEQLHAMQKMDVFSLGCAILEVLRDGKPLMNFESYLQFKKGQFPIQHYIQQGCKVIHDPKQAQTIRKLLKSMLSLSAQDRPNIQQIMNTYDTIINLNLYSLIWHCTSAFSTTSFLLPDLRISLMHSIFKFIQLEERGNTLQFKIAAPKCLQSFQALKIFRSIIKNKIFYIDQIPQNSILKKLLDHTQTEPLVQSQQQQIMNQDPDLRKQLFVPLQPTRKNSSMRMSTLMIPKLEKVLTPPEWGRQLKSLIEPKYRGMRLTHPEILKNRFQDLLEDYKRNQTVRDMRIRMCSAFYRQYNMVIRVVYSCIRGCRYNSSKLVGIEMLMIIAKQSSDLTRLVKLVPLLISLLDDPDIVTAKYAFNSLIDLFYMFIDPFNSQQDTLYYDIIIEMFINSIKNSRLRINFFKRLSEIYCICEWLQVHIKKIGKKIQHKNSLKRLVQVIKSSYGSYQPQEVRELMVNIPDIMWPDMFQFFISFLNTQKILGLQKGVSLALVDVQSHKKIIDVIDNCIQSSLEENGFSLYYAIKYFSVRKLFTLTIVKKICPLVIHPHLWVRQQAKQYMRMCLQQNPPTRIFFLFRQVFNPPFPLQPKDMQDDILIPQPFLQSQIDFQKKKIKQNRNFGLTQRYFQQYLQKVKASKSYPFTKQTQVQSWQQLYKLLIEQKIQPTLFNNFIKKSIIELYEANFLYYVGNVKCPFKSTIKQEQRKRQNDQLHEALKKWNILTLQDNQVVYEKKDFFISFSTTLNSNFQKLLTRFMKQDKTNKIRISQSIYLVMQTLYKFEQFNIKQAFKLGQVYNKANQTEKLQRVKGTLITQIFQHKDMISCMQNIADKYLISASYDGTVRIFNANKIQLNITAESEGVYELASDHSQQKVRINSIAAFQNTYSIAAATNKGNIRVFQIERMKGKKLQGNNRNSINQNNNTQFLKYCVGGQIEKILTFKNQNRNQCFCYITGQGVLGVQDIRAKSKTLFCNFGKQRGLAKSLAFSMIGPSILIGTLDGYVLTYDIRCNLISSIRQLQYENNPISITGIYPSPFQVDGRNLFAITYPSKYYQFSYFDIYNDSLQFLPERQYTSCNRQDIISVPKMVNRTKQQNFKLCNNSLAQKIYYKQLSDFNRNFKILQYLSDPFTIKQSKMRQVWMDRCKHRYNQIYSIFNKKSLPFLHHLQSPTTTTPSILTNLNPCLTSQSEKKSTKNLSVLVEKVDVREYYETEKLVTCRPPNSRVYTFGDEENGDYLTCCGVVGGMVFVGGWDSVVRVYK